MAAADVGESSGAVELPPSADAVVAEAAVPAGAAVLESFPVTDSQGRGRVGSLQCLRSRRSRHNRRRASFSGALHLSRDGACRLRQRRECWQLPGAVFPSAPRSCGHRAANLVHHKPPIGTKQAKLATPLALSVQANTYTTVTSLSLPAGKWLLTGVVTLSADQLSGGDFPPVRATEGHRQPGIQRATWHRRSAQHRVDRHGHALGQRGPSSSACAHDLTGSSALVLPNTATLIAEPVKSIG